MKKVSALLVMCTLTTAAVGTSFGHVSRTQKANVATLIKSTPAPIELGNSPDQGAFPLLAAAFVGGVAIGYAVGEYVHHHIFGDCRSMGPQVDLDSDAMF